MTLGALAAAALALVLAWSFVALKPVRTPKPVRRALSPLDEAERILTARYARGTITAQEYERMIAVLRR